MAHSPMPFITGPVTIPDSQLRLSPPQGDLVAIVPLSKVQEVLWLDYIRRPWATHYALTLRIDLTESKLSLETILNYIHQLGIENDMLRTTFHMDGTAQDMSQSYMAVHDSTDCIQNAEIMGDDAKLAQALRRPFDLSKEFPVRWVIHQHFASNEGFLKSSYTVYAMGHHIAVDGSSISYLSRRFLELVSQDGVVAPSSSSAPSYGEFVQRQNAYLRSSAAKVARSFWLSQTANTTPCEWKHATPSAPPPAGRDYRQMNTWGFFTFDELAEWSKLYGTSWFRIATSIVGLVVAGHSKPTPHHDHTLQVALGAREPRFAECISHMANTMPIRQPVWELLQRDGTFAELVKNVGKRISQAKKHEMFPFMSLLEAARQEARGDEVMSEKVVVTYSPKLADARCTLYPVQGVWDLFFCFLEAGDGVSLGVITDPAAFDHAAVEALKTDFMSTVRLSQASAGFKLSSLFYLQGHETAALVGGPKITDADAVSSSRVTDWIRQRAAAQPDAIALYSGEEKTSMTYGELDEKSDSKALHLQQHGVSREDVVVLHIDRSFDVVVWILAILKAGACYVVLEKSLPLARKQAILGVAEAKLFVTDIIDNALFANCAWIPEVLNIWAKADLPAGRPQPVAGQDPTDLAYIIFTSGSTGMPKAIMVEHQNLSSYVSSARETVKIGPGSRVLQLATFAFDASILECAVTLSYGGTMCFVNHPSLLVGDYLADMVDLNKINFIHLTPSVLSTIPDGRRLPSLRMLSVGGEASSAGLLDKWSKRLTLIHAYGPTETTVICATETVVPSGEKLPSPSNIGRANPNMATIICSEGSDQTLEQGQMGEICIVGPQVTRGYKGQPELTADKFRTIEFEGRSARMYRSGDKGYIDAEGKLNIFGRMNREIKLRGYRMDLAAIEKSILDYCPEVMMASVQVVKESLVAFVAPNTIQGRLIRERISKDLPSYSVPTLFTALNNLPLNANGKVDHAQVLEQFCNEDNESVPEATLQTEPDIFVDGLPESPGIDADTTFYDAGGHSILLTALHKKLALQYPGSGISLLDVFYNPTIRRQAAHLADLVAVNSPPPCTVSDESLSMTRTHSSRSSITNASLLLQQQESLFAIVGMAGRFPGADSVDDMWDLLMEQRDGITTSSATGDELEPGEVFVPRYGSINGLEAFRGSDWAMSDEEANNLDPQKRMFLVVAQEALKDASISTSRTQGTNIGTFIGIAHNTFLHSGSEAAVTDSFERRYRVVLDPNASTFTAYKLNLTGPSVDINTACASSLVAIHQAINSLRAGDCETALVGGVSVSFPQLGGYATSDGKIFSVSGECRPLDARSDGSVPADGVSAVVLKPLSAARAAGDRIYAVIEGHAIGTDGAVDKIGFTVPSSTGQAKVVRDAIVSSGVDPQSIRYVEMHGSGTSIGDALEAQGLERAFSAAEAAWAGGELPSTTSSTRLSSGTGSAAMSRSASRAKAVPSPAARELLVGSNKGSFGNSEAASGLTSLIKASLAVHRGVVPPMPQIGDVNPLIDLSKTRVRPLRSHLKLEIGDRVGVTALGYGGVNAHCIVSSPETADLEQRVQA
ncbi:AMP-binding enzyme domain-containing protein [Hirsutella rhossiliensis]|uniref:AMP-binding enzyme domain-containing protein n=1 Tax=Hirsutella rhossiliensis TaxID=111463 RepID=A0A9P8SFR1_9HYPO|nr:AMP-binding enzyme domain-containing protein [Hirsutella rhossiliensis]KAH0959690.1 AMP-binding enzyme domain-containing protein [Hirsutella rhossiliensis]